jgi:hypothetical protein
VADRSPERVRRRPSPARQAHPGGRRDEPRDDNAGQGASSGDEQILWSENDVSLNESAGRDLESELRRADATVEMKVYPGFKQNGHTLFFLAEGYPVYVPDAKRFLDSHLKR